MSAAALLAKNADPTDEEIDAAMAGNICRCGMYGRIKSAIRTVASGQTPESVTGNFYNAAVEVAGE